MSEPLHKLVQCADKRISGEKKEINMTSLKGLKRCCAGDIVCDFMEHIECPSAVLRGGVQKVLLGLSATLTYLLTLLTAPL